MKPPELRQFLATVYNYELYQALPPLAFHPGVEPNIAGMWLQKKERFEQALKDSGILLFLYGSGRLISSVEFMGHNSENNEAHLPRQILPAFFEFVDFVFGTLPIRGAKRELFIMNCAGLPSIRRHINRNRGMRKEIRLFYRGSAGPLLILKPYEDIKFPRHKCHA